MNEGMKIAFYGDMARNHEIDLYDAGRSNGGEYIGCVNKEVVDSLESDVPDDKITSVSAIVESFSRKSKKGIAFSNELGRGFRFSSTSMGKLGKEDDFSWSQYKQEEIVMTGRFYYFFDGSIKRLEVFSVEKEQL